MTPEEQARAMETAPGHVQWHSSEEDGGPDVGLLIGLGDDKALWIGERTNRERGGVGLLIYKGNQIIENADLGDFDQMRDALEFHVAPALSALSREEQVRAEERWRPIADMASAMAEAEAVIVGWWFVHPRLGTSWETDTDPFNPNATHFALLPAPPSLRASGHEGGGNG